MATTVRRAFPPAPFVTPGGDDVDIKFAQVTEAINRKADASATPMFSAILLRSSDGSTWQVRISPMGVLIIDQVDV
jgi:hypothetical protein